MLEDDLRMLGDDIMNTIDQAVNSQNFERLNSDIKRSIDQAADITRENVRYANETFNDVFSSDGQHARIKNYNQRRRTLFKDVSRIPVYIYTVFCGLMTFGGLDVLISELPYEFVLNAALTAFFGWITFTGIRKLGRIKRFKKYQGYLGDRSYSLISDLASAVGKSEATVQKDLEYMISKGWFKQGHIDIEKTTLMINNEIYNDYLKLREQRRQQKIDEENKKVRQKAQMGAKYEQYAAQQQAQKQAEADKQSELSSEVAETIRKGRAYVQEIHRCNDEIPGEEISAKMDTMEQIVDDIFDRVESHPETVGQVRKLLDYYLPTTIKLLQAYEELDNENLSSEHVEASKKEIEDSIDTLNVGFEKILNCLFQDQAWDVSSDISALKTMMAQDGLQQSDF